jgi:hypothetical protein
MVDPASRRMFYMKSIWWFRKIGADREALPVAG